MKEKIKVVYVGYHAETLHVLCGDNEFDVVGTSLIGELTSVGTLNPINLFFKLIYNLRRQNICWLLERMLLLVWPLAARCTSSFYRRYSDYLKILSERKMEIVDFSNTATAMDFLKSNRVDLMVVCAWSILPEELITLPKYGTVNIHPSKLPQYRGALPTLWSLKNGDKESAVTYLLMDNGVDAGAIIGQHVFPINAGDDWYSLEVKTNSILQKTLVADLKRHLSGEVKPTVQDLRKKSITGKYAEYMKIDWVAEDGQEIYNKVNLYPFLVPTEYCYTFLGDKKIVLKKAAFLKSHVTLPMLGQYQVRGLALLVQAKHGLIGCSLFSELKFKDSFLFMLKRSGKFA